MPAALLGLCVRRDWRVGLGERLGARPELPDRPLWLHAASVGEIRAALPLIDLLSAEGALVVSATTATGRELMRAERPDIPCHLAPADHPWLVRRALAAVKPRRLVFVETELWPCLIQAADEVGCTLVAVSARMSERSRRRYARLGSFASGFLGRFQGIGARSDRDAERFLQLGAPRERVRVTGDLKLSAAAELAAPAADLLRALSGVAYWVAGSTHAGEETAALEAAAQLDAIGAKAVLVLAPRHPRRFDEVAAEVQGRGLPLERRSALPAEPLAPGSVLLLDSIGELASLYADARVAFIGGSLVARGGHNPIEAARAGCPVLMGPHSENARDALNLLLEAGSAARLADAEALAEELRNAWAEPEVARERGRLGRLALAPHRDAAARTAAWLASLPDREG